MYNEMLLAVSMAKKKQITKVLIILQWANSGQTVFECIYIFPHLLKFFGNLFKMK
jgi:hypothetical protein